MGGAPTMSTVFLHVGQCGNQVGQSFWQETASWYSPARIPSHSSSKTTKPPSTSCSAFVAPSNPYLLLDGTLPCILVDTESKVIKKCTDEKTCLGKVIPEDCRVMERRGRGNNWAYGYFDAKGKVVESKRRVRNFELGVNESERLVDTVQECVRRLVEKCDRFGGFLQLHSIAGGTGSGVGSAIIEQLREDYPLSYILTVTVAPFSHGETPLQHYNSLLCLHHLQTQADGIILFQNDHILAQTLKSIGLASKSVPATSQASRPARAMASSASGTHPGSSGSVSVEDMNRYMSSVICNTLLPVWSAKQKVPPLSSREPWELIRSVCPDPGMKFILPSHCQLTRPTQTWDSAFSVVTSTFKTATFKETAAKSMTDLVTPTSRAQTGALVAICRAHPTAMGSLVPHTSSIEKRLKQTYNTVQWNPFPVDFWSSYEPHLRDTKMVSVLANSAAVRNYLQCVVDRARLMYRERAYLHWYERYGCKGGMFEESFETVEGVIENYTTMVS